MKYDFILTGEQQALVEQNMELVGRVISRHIRTNEGIERGVLYNFYPGCNSFSIKDEPSLRYILNESNVV